MRHVLAFALALCVAAPVHAGGTIRGTVVVEDARGNAQPLPPVVVFVEDFIEPFTPAETPAIHQANKRFAPAMTLVPVGVPVAFPNDDPIDHNVFSVSPVKSFDLGLYSGGKAKTVIFDKPGPVRIYCNIHPQMIGDILVLPNRYHALVGPNGSFTLEGVPPGQHRVRAWFARGPSVARVADVADGQTVDVQFRLLQTVVTDAHLNKLGQPYPIRY
jgi:plastocyanin